MTCNTKLLSWGERDFDFASSPHSNFNFGHSTLPVGVSQVEVFRYKQSMPSHGQQMDDVAQEIPVALVFNGVSHTVMMASPNHLEDFALGFAITEGLIHNLSEIYGIDEVDLANGIELHIEVSALAERRIKEKRRSLAGRTGCGLCGAESIEQVQRKLSSVAAIEVQAPIILQAVNQLYKEQPLQQLTGATHAAAWVTLEGHIQSIREDVGRHNALDKLIGHLIKQKTIPQLGFIAITSRASFEMVQKTVAFGAGLLAAVSAPTQLAIQVASSHNLALVGFVRAHQLVTYSFPERVGLVNTSANKVMHFNSN